MSRRISPDELEASIAALSPCEQEVARLDYMIDPLFDMWLRFREAFANRAIDKLDVTNEDAEAAAKKMEAIGSAGDAFAALLRYIPTQRLNRRVSHMVSAIDATGGFDHALTYPEIYERYEKLNKGSA